MIISENTSSSLIPAYTRSAPFTGNILHREQLSKEGSSRKTYHITLDIADSGISYRPGDSIGILPENDPLITNEIINLIGADGTEKILDSKRGNIEVSFSDYLLRRANLSRISSSLLLTLAKSTEDSHAASLLTHLSQKENKEQLTAFSEKHDIIDILRLARFRLSAEELCFCLSPLLPRFYSICSSQKEDEKLVELTVALASFTKAGVERYGVATHFLCNLAKVQTTPIELYIQPTHSFLLPEDTTKDIIMIGPGTGVAPFRAFLQERIKTNALGRHWLFFGERSRSYDFYYESYLTSLSQKGVLRLDCAFSRDQEEKIYVQHKMLENSRDLWLWLQSGALIYICGDAEKMAKDVEKALIDIAQHEGVMDEDSARSYVKSLRAEKRLLLDVY